MKSCIDNEICKLNFTISGSRVKGLTENALMKLAFKDQYNFRLANENHQKAEKCEKSFKIMDPLIDPFFLAKTLKLSEVGQHHWNLQP